MLNNQFWKVKNSPLELEKGFMEWKNGEKKIKRKIEELFYKSTIESKDDMDKFEE